MSIDLVESIVDLYQSFIDMFRNFLDIVLLLQLMITNQNLNLNMTLNLNLILKQEFAINTCKTKLITKITKIKKKVRQKKIK